MIASLGAASGAAAWLVIHTMGPGNLRYVAEHGTTRTTDGAFLAPSGAGAVQFSDGTRVALEPTARIALAAITPHGAGIRLQQGTIDVDVRKQPGSHWTFEAGPFTVAVKGTSFSLEWNQGQGRGELKMWTGTVVVARDPRHAPVAVKAGQALMLNEAGELRATDMYVAPIGVGISAPPETTVDPPRESPGAQEGAPPLSIKNGSRRRDRLAQGARSSAPEGWGSLIARGEFGEVLTQANQRGIEPILSHGPSADVAALGDAARYLRQNDLARRALLALRDRFPGTEQAKSAAFFLGRVGEVTHSDANATLAWYDCYLRESPSGPYVEGALAQEMILLRQQNSPERARAVARRYLSEHPHGTYRNLAARTVDEPDGQ